MNLKAVKAIELRSKASEFLWSFRVSMIGVSRRDGVVLKPAMPAPRMVKDCPAICEEDLDSPQLQRLLAILKRLLREDKQFDPSDSNTLYECLNVPVGMVYLQKNQRDHRLTFRCDGPSERVCAENLCEYFQMLASNPGLMDRQPLKLCNCGRVFLKARANQLYCSPKCETTAWQASHPGYWREDRSLLAERRKKRLCKV